MRALPLEKRIPPGPRRGALTAPASKSLVQRLFLCAALGRGDTVVRCGDLSRDAAATLRCLEALGAEVRTEGDEARIRGPEAWRTGADLPCGESGAALRFLLPLLGALGLEARLLPEGSLARRPLSPLWELLEARGMVLRREGDAVRCAGRLKAGAYALPGNVSSQFVSGLLFALPLLAGDSELTVTGPLGSADYVNLTEEALRRCGVRLERRGQTWRVPGGQTYAPPPALTAEGDWSAAAFFLCMGALSPAGITVRGLDPASGQGDRRVLDLLRAAGAAVTVSEAGITVRRGALRPFDFDADPCPDLAPPLAVLAAACPGESRIIGAGRLRLKESDRLRTTAALLKALGGAAEETAEGLVIRGGKLLSGGGADAFGDHRIAMAAALAACACRGAVTLRGAESVEKSYPRFWGDFDALEMVT